MTPVVRYRRRDDVLSRAFAGEVLLAAPEREGVDRLDLTAAAVWDALEGAATALEISAAMSSVYDAPRELIVHDVDALLSDLVARGWVVEGRDG